MQVSLLKNRSIVGGMQSFQPYLDYFGQDPTWALIIIFLIAFGEALLIIGLFVPSTAILVGAGVLVGSGHLEFWPVFFATAIGAIVGDQISYWAGRFYGQSLRHRWPLNRFPQLVERGEEFVRNHGGKSIALGRFVPGVKAVVPGIVGMLGMGQVFFLTVNVSSGLVWAIAHIVPGILLGQGLALAGELSGRLALVLLALIVLLAIAGWFIRLFFAVGISPWLAHLLERISAWAKTRKSRSMHRFGRAISPQNPRSMFIVFFTAVLVFAIVAFIFLTAGYAFRASLPNLDLSIHNLMREIRNAPADELMIPLTMLGDTVVLLALMATIVLWLAWRKAWRAAIACTVAFAGGKAVQVLFKLAIQRDRPVPFYDGAEAFSFPSGHAAMATLTFGVLAVLASHAMGRWSRSLVYAICGLLVVAIGFSRIYLGAHWLSDVLGGLLLGAILVAAFGVVIEAIPPRRIMPTGLLGAALIALTIAGNIHIGSSFNSAEKLYAVHTPTFAIRAEDWQANGWQRLPAARIDLAGVPEERFIVQWAGSIEALEAQLAARQWQVSLKWKWADSFAYLDSTATLEQALPRPALHEGLKAKLTMVLPLSDDATQRLTLRAYKTDAVLRSAQTNMPILLLSLTRESLRKSLLTFAVPTLSQPNAAQIEEFRQALTAAAVQQVADIEINKTARLLLVTAP